MSDSPEHQNELLTFTPEELFQAVQEFSPKFVRLRDLANQQEADEARLLMKYREDTTDRRAQISELEAEDREFRAKITEALQRTTLYTGQRTYFDGMVTTAIRTRAGAVNEEVFEQWAREFGTLTFPDKKSPKYSQLLDYLREHRPDLLEVDRTASLREAIKTSESGRRFWPESGVEIETFATAMSDEKWNSVMFTSSIAFEFSQRQEVSDDGKIDG